MKAEALIEALRELQVRGFKSMCEFDDDLLEIRLFESPKSYGAWDVEVYKGEEVEGSHLWIVQGWLVSQLEARGLRREVEWGRSGHAICRVRLVYDPPTWSQGLYGHHGEWCDTELGALINARLSLPTEATP
jgi:hypothetical protein